MISIMTSTSKMTGLPIAPACSLGLTFASLPAFPATGLAGGVAALPVISAARPVRERNERPTKASGAAVAAAQAKAYAFAATDAGVQQQTTEHDHSMWAFRGLEPWSDPV